MGALVLASEACFIPVEDADGNYGFVNEGKADYDSTFPLTYPLDLSRAVIGFYSMMKENGYAPLLSSRMVAKYIGEGTIIERAESLAKKMNLDLDVSASDLLKDHPEILLAEQAARDAASASASEKGEPEWNLEEGIKDLDTFGEGNLAEAEIAVETDDEIMDEIAEDEIANKEMA